MTKHRPVVFVTRKLPDVVETRMMELFQTKLNVDDHAMGKAELIEAVKTADVLVPTVTDRIDKTILAQAGVVRRRASFELDSIAKIIKQVEVF